MWAAAAGRLDIAEELIIRGADVDAQDSVILSNKFVYLSLR